MPKGIKGFQKGNDSWTKWKSRPDYSGSNNPNFGKSHTEEVKEKLRKLHLNEGSPTWKGDKVGKSAVHRWVKSRKTKPEVCEHCKIKEATDLSSTNHTYTRNLNEWEWLCRKCHVKKDGGSWKPKKYANTRTT